MIKRELNQQTEVFILYDVACLLKRHLEVCNVYNVTCVMCMCIMCTYYMCYVYVYYVYILHVLCVCVLCVHVTCVMCMCIMCTCYMCYVYVYYVYCTCMYVRMWLYSFIITVDFEHCVLCTLIPESEQVVLDSWNPCSVTLLI